MKCDLRGISIHYETRGQGRPVLFLHASPSDHSRAMAHLEPAFRSRKGWRRIYPDLPGHGKTPGADRIRDMDDYLGVLLEFVDDVFGKGRFALGGISFGAYLALGIARKRASRIDGILLSVPEVDHSPIEERRDRDFGTPSIQTPAHLAVGLPEYTEETAWLESLPFRNVSAPLYHSPKPFPAPALFLFGRQDAPFRYRKYWRLLPDFPRATYAVLDGAGHTLWSDRNELASLLVRDWLDRVETWSPRNRRST
ncbi:MAG TPA: alpha/beta hydrolase [Thermoplasmata archaeon]|nr:alpha/beta hydrolase [Thermoplasmata archaeon]